MAWWFSGWYPSCSSSVTDQSWTLSLTCGYIYQLFISNHTEKSNLLDASLEPTETAGDSNNYNLPLYNSLLPIALKAHYKCGGESLLLFYMWNKRSTERWREPMAELRTEPPSLGLVLQHLGHRCSYLMTDQYSLYPEANLICYMSWHATVIIPDHIQRPENSSGGRREKSAGCSNDPDVRLNNWDLKYPF